MLWQIMRNTMFYPLAVAVAFYFFLLATCLADTFKREGNNLTVTCEGFGADKSISLKQATDQCRSIASDYVKGSSFRVQQLALQDNEQSYWHSEVSSELQVTGLACQPLKETTTSNEIEEYKTTLTCRFDLSKAKAVPISEMQSVSQGDDSTEDRLVKNAVQIQEVPKSKGSIAKKEFVKSEAQQILIASVPMCFAILVRGQRPRSIKCTQNPQSVLIHTASDRQLIVKARGYLPRTILLSGRKPASSETEVIHVYLERAK